MRYTKGGEVMNVLLLILLFIAVILYLKNKVGMMIITSCFIHVTGREPTNEEIKENSAFVVENIINDIKCWFGNKN